METPITGTVLSDLTAEVEIPENGTLSRVLYKDDNVRLVAFAFDTGQELTDHTAGVPALIQVVSGRFELSLDGELSEIGPKSWVHMDAGLTHAVKALEPSVMVLTLLKVNR
ncbi:MAG: cupin domain-containing protein [Acidimicrobiia bacterium]|nr:cupin domain-containing protein [Acidimicrobiia bacterium]MDX2466836.1 cupin domain-containing protein [Acidimicrobiia bacterium]